MSAALRRDEHMKGKVEEKKPGSKGFQPVPDRQLIKTKRQLPHWQMGGSTYFITFRTKIFNLPIEARRVVLEAFCYFNDSKYRLWAAVVMLDHVHLLLTPKEKAEGGFFSLTEILHSLKSFTGNKINTVLNRQGT